MSDRSDEVSVSRESDSGPSSSPSPDPSSDPTTDSTPNSTDDLLEQTERLLSGGSGADRDPSAESGSTSSRADGELEPTGESTESADSTWQSWLPSRASAEVSEEPSEAQSSRSWFSWLSLSTYFSPKAFLALVFVLGAGLLAGSMILPIGGNMVGMFVVAFTVGLLTSRRRYNEMTAAGATIGGISAMFEYTVPMLAGSSSTFLAIGVTAGFLACVVGYYFGRDLRSGLSREI